MSYSYTFQNYDAWKLSGPPEAREDGFFKCEDSCGWSKYFQYAEDAPEVCPHCEAQLIEADVAEYDEGRADAEADDRYDRMREREWD